MGNSHIKIRLTRGFSNAILFYDDWMECKVPTLTYHMDKNHENKMALKDELSEQSIF